MSKPTKVKCTLMVYLLQYISGTVDMGIRFSGSRFDIHVFTDANWAGDMLTRRSTTGYVVFAAGRPLACGSHLRATVAASSVQSKWIGLKRVLRQLGKASALVTEDNRWKRLR